MSSFEVVFLGFHNVLKQGFLELMVLMVYIFKYRTLYAKQRWLYHYDLALRCVWSLRKFRN